MRRPAVIDTNVVVAGLLTSDVESPTARILGAMLRAEIPCVVSVELLAEYREVLLRRAVASLHRLTDRQVDRLLTEIALNAVVAEPKTAAGSPSDPGDRHIWDLLRAMPEAILVTGDRRLAKEAPEGTSVLSPRAFAELLGRD